MELDKVINDKHLKWEYVFKPIKKFGTITLHEQLGQTYRMWMTDDKGKEIVGDSLQIKELWDDVCLALAKYPARNFKKS